MSHTAVLWNTCPQWIVYALGEMLFCKSCCCLCSCCTQALFSEWLSGSLRSWWTINIFNYTQLKLLECGWIFYVIDGLICSLSVVFQISHVACSSCLPIAASSLAVPPSRVSDYSCNLLLVSVCTLFSLVLECVFG